MSKLSLAIKSIFFVSADYIIGPHGAASYKSGICKAGSNFHRIFFQGHYSPSFNRFCAIRELKYGFLIGEPTTESAGSQLNPRDLRSNIGASIAADIVRP